MRLKHAYSDVPTLLNHLLNQSTVKDVRHRFRWFHQIHKIDEHHRSIPSVVRQHLGDQLQ